MAIRLYMGVARAVARRELMAGPDYRASYLERTQKGIQDMLGAIRDGRVIPDPDLMTRVKKENYDKEKQIMTVSDKHGNTVDIYVGVGKEPAGTLWVSSSESLSRTKTGSDSATDTVSSISSSASLRALSR